MAQVREIFTAFVLPKNAQKSESPADRQPTSRYVADPRDPHKVTRIDPDGTRTQGSWLYGGEFVPRKL